MTEPLQLDDGQPGENTSITSLQNQTLPVGVNSGGAREDTPKDPGVVVGQATKQTTGLRTDVASINKNNNNTSGSKYTRRKRRAQHREQNKKDTADFLSSETEKYNTESEESREQPKAPKGYSSLSKLTDDAVQPVIATRAIPVIEDYYGAAPIPVIVRGVFSSSKVALLARTFPRYLLRFVADRSGGHPFLTACRELVYHEMFLMKGNFTKIVDVWGSCARSLARSALARKHGLLHIDGTWAVNAGPDPHAAFDYDDFGQDCASCDCLITDSCPVCSAVPDGTYGTAAIFYDVASHVSADDIHTCLLKRGYVTSYFVVKSFHGLSGSFQDEYLWRRDNRELFCVHAKLSDVPQCYTLFEPDYLWGADPRLTVSHVASFGFDHVYRVSLASAMPCSEPKLRFGFDSELPAFSDLESIVQCVISSASSYTTCFDIVRRIISVLPVCQLQSLCSSYCSLLTAYDLDVASNFSGGCDRHVVGKEIFVFSPGRKYSVCVSAADTAIVRFSDPTLSSSDLRKFDRGLRRSMHDAGVSSEYHDSVYLPTLLYVFCSALRNTYSAGPSFLVDMKNDDPSSLFSNYFNLSDFLDYPGVYDELCRLSVTFFSSLLIFVPSILLILFAFIFDYCLGIINLNYYVFNLFCILNLLVALVLPFGARYYQNRRHGTKPARTRRSFVSSFASASHPSLWPDAAYPKTFISDVRPVRTIDSYCVSSTGHLDSSQFVSNVCDANTFLTVVGPIPDFSLSTARQCCHNVIAGLEKRVLVIAPEFTQCVVCKSCQIVNNLLQDCGQFIVEVFKPFFVNHPISASVDPSVTNKMCAAAESSSPFRNAYKRFCSDSHDLLDSAKPIHDVFNRINDSMGGVRVPDMEPLDEEEFMSDLSGKEEIAYREACGSGLINDNVSYPLQQFSSFNTDSTHPRRVLESTTCSVHIKIETQVKSAVPDFFFLTPRIISVFLALYQYRIGRYTRKLLTLLSASFNDSFDPSLDGFIVLWNVCCSPVKMCVKRYRWICCHNGSIPVNKDDEKRDASYTEATWSFCCWALFFLGVPIDVCVAIYICFFRFCTTRDKCVPQNLIVFAMPSGLAITTLFNCIITTYQSWRIWCARPPCLVSLLSLACGDDSQDNFFFSGLKTPHVSFCLSPAFYRLYSSLCLDIGFKCTFAFRNEGIAEFCSALLCPVRHKITGALCDLMLPKIAKALKSFAMSYTPISKSMAGLHALIASLRDRWSLVPLLSAVISAYDSCQFVVNANVRLSPLSTRDEIYKKDKNFNKYRRCPETDDFYSKFYSIPLPVLLELDKQVFIFYRTHMFAPCTFHSELLCDMLYRECDSDDNSLSSPPIFKTDNIERCSGVSTSLVVTDSSPKSFVDSTTVMDGWLVYGCIFFLFYAQNYLIPFTSFFGVGVQAAVADVDVSRIGIMCFTEECIKAFFPLMVSIWSLACLLLLSPFTFEVCLSYFYLCYSLLVIPFSIAFGVFEVHAKYKSWSALSVSQRPPFIYCLPALLMHCACSMLPFYFAVLLHFCYNLVVHLLEIGGLFSVTSNGRFHPPMCCALLLGSIQPHSNLFGPGEPAVISRPQNPNKTTNKISISVYYSINLITNLKFKIQKHYQIMTKQETIKETKTVEKTPKGATRTTVHKTEHIREKKPARERRSNARRESGNSNSHGGRRNGRPRQPRARPVADSNSSLAHFHSKMQVSNPCFLACLASPFTAEQSMKKYGMTLEHCLPPDLEMGKVSPFLWNSSGQLTLNSSGKGAMVLFPFPSGPLVVKPYPATNSTPATISGHTFPQLTSLVNVSTEYIVFAVGLRWRAATAAMVRQGICRWARVLPPALTNSGTIDASTFMNAASISAIEGSASGDMATADKCQVVLVPEAVSIAYSTSSAGQINKFFRQGKYAAFYGGQTHADSWGYMPGSTAVIYAEAAQASIPIIFDGDANGIINFEMCLFGCYKPGNSAVHSVDPSPRPPHSLVGRLIDVAEDGVDDVFAAAAHPLADLASVADDVLKVGSHIPMVGALASDADSLLNLGRKIL